MYMKLYRFLLIILFLLLVTACSTVRKTPYLSPQTDVKREFRGAWIQTVFQDEYKKMTPKQMKRDFIKKLDYLKTCGINAVIFQIRPEADAFYQSNLEPWSRFLTGKQGQAPENNFDPMAFLIEECHKRNMEFHAWLNPYRASTSGKEIFANTHIYHQYPERFVTYNKQILFDPGVPENRKYICQVVRDIVSRYDVDAIHMDDYFYPYPAAGMPFPDDNSFRKYGKKYKEERRGDWRRENVNLLVKELKQTISTTKPWVRFGISPFGIYRNNKNSKNGSATNGLQNYDDLYADVIHWTKKGWIDYNIPQIYWEIGHSAADYITLALWWNQHTYKEHLYIGQDVARTMKADQLTTKMKYERSLPQVKGNCFWPANEILWNNKGIADSLKQNYHRYPALIPAYTNMSKKKPEEIKEIIMTPTTKGVQLSWETKQNKAKPEAPTYFVVYRFQEREKINLNSSHHIVSITPAANYLIKKEDFDGKTYQYVITTVNRFHNESKKGKKVLITL